MIRLSVFYPSSDGATFDHDYYREKHVPLCVNTWGLKGAEIDKWLDGPYGAAVHFTFDCLEARGAAVGGGGGGARGGAGTGATLADVANYTTISPVLQTSEIV